MTISFQNIKFAYGNQDVLHGVSGDLKSGGFYAIVGPNGCGKSTLIKCLDNILHPHTGTIELDGVSINKIRKIDLAKKVAYVAQTSKIIFPLDVFSTVMLGRRPHVGWLPGNKDRKLVYRIIDELGLSDLTMRNIDEISGGELQRVQIARALAQEPSVLLLDEPTSSLDLKYQIEVMQLLKQVSENKKITIVTVIHDLNLATRYASNFFLMKKGHIIAHGGKEVINEENIKTLYETEVQKISHGSQTYILPI
ncbi:ABC transporter ATP-binding protein [Natronoflexus pectinivorans]|uniref:Iron complex transport system ATP-binding protein n=1 Tax=Natronoflexus pectinivorans TaxID=682526 RepID=A0A4R2GBK5_9BACT|nr:ABC transporter ATP-binding protein [Natronoflexus pectinivorans]TCO05408.1 iron complex transport system ATP-binding protein [Natronoflexus pectinivorans]